MQTEQSRNDDSRSPEETWPAVHLAFDVVRPSYDWAINRINATDSRSQALIVFSGSFTVAAPVLIVSLANDISFTSGWFLSGLGVFLLNTIVGTLAKNYGGVKLLSLNHIYEEKNGYTIQIGSSRSKRLTGQDVISKKTLRLLIAKGSS